MKQKLRNHKLISPQGNRVQGASTDYCPLSPFPIIPFALVFDSTLAEQEQGRKEGDKASAQEEAELNGMLLEYLISSRASLDFYFISYYFFLLSPFSHSQSLSFLLLLRAIILQRACFLCFLFVRAVNDSK